MAADDPRKISPQSAALNAARIALEPIVAMLLEAGVGSHELTRLLRWMYVNQSAARLKGPSRRPSASRIAAATGLTRAEVRHLRTESSLPAPLLLSAPRASDKILAGWARDPDFLGAHGNPRPLAYVDGERGFSELVRRYSQDIPPRAMLNELIDSMLVSEVAPGQYLPVPRSQRPPRPDGDAVADFAAKLNALGATLLRNLRDPDGGRLFDSLVLTTCTAPNHIAKISRDLERRCRTFSQAIERYLIDQANKVPANDVEGDGGQQLGVIVAVVERYSSSDASDQSTDSGHED
ncbi:MAG: DUF6502 family protein [Candidatus Binatales bacterium]